MAAICFTRPADGGGLFRRLTVEIGGRKASALKYNSEQTVEVAPGTHVVQARMDWTTSESIQIEVSEGQTVRVEASLPASAIIGMMKNPSSALRIRQL